MIVQCPNCRTKYRFDESNIKSGSITMRCSKCSHLFRHPPEEEPELSEMPVFDEGGAEPDNQWEDSQEVGASKKGESAGASAGDEKTDFRIDFDAPPVKGGSRVLVATLALVLILSVFLALWMYYPLLKPHFPSWMGGDDTVSQVEQAVDPAMAAAQVRDISLENVRQYTVNNEKIGRLFVIEGKAVNRFPTTKELIKVRADLLDSGGNRVVTREFYCGNTVSLFQLQVYNAEELEAALSAKVGILTNNTNVAPGGDTPFMVVVPNPPDTVKEFEVTVVEAKDPPPSS
ncbi:MAG: DUF3426 domain-containing protein [Deltaproteobacteria bacterium]|nr:DUF3426 domain-containing protein [Deltaproteobacteria bacterium]